MVHMFATFPGIRLATTALAVPLLAAPILSSQQGPRSLRRAEAYRPNCPAKDRACDARAQFRVGHHYPYQAIQWKRLPDHRVAIMPLEPPPVMPIADLEELIRSAFGSDLLSYDRLLWQIGVDGWLEDTVLTITARSGAPDSDPMGNAVFRDRAAFLHLALFGTTYGARFDMQREGLFAGPSDAAPNLLIQPGEVRRWMNGPTLKWEPLGDTPREVASWQDITTRRMTEAFVATDRTVAMLTFPGETLKNASR
jgi:hypothetical protein